jgi:hypothetical protein
MDEQRNGKTTTAEEVGALHGEVRALRERVAAQERRRAAPAAPRRRSRGRLMAVFIGALLAALVPLTLLAANPFTDLNDGSPHNGNIAAIADAGITKGCNPPENTQYCPNEYVTREQMASFLARAAGLGGSPPVANAKTAQTAGTAGDANTVGGLAPSGLTRFAYTTKAGATKVADGGQDLLAVTITAPQPAYVRVQFSGTWYAESSGGNCPCTMGASFRLGSGASRLVTTQTLLSLIDSTGFERSSAAGMMVFVVPAGEHTFTLSASYLAKANPSPNAGLSGIELTAELFPFDGQGQRP